MSSAPEVVIVGAGVIGAACASRLAREGRRVRLIERGGEAGEAWRASAGMLAPQIETAADPAMFGLGIAGRQFYATNGPALKESTGIDIELKLEGILDLAETETEEEGLRQRIEKQRRLGHDAEWLDASTVALRWPWLATSVGGLLAPRDGFLTPTRLVEALRAEAVRFGTEICTDEVTSIIREKNRIRGVRGRQEHQAELVVLAAGAWSGRLGGLPRPLSVEPIRGQMVAYPRPAGELITVFGKGAYLLPREAEAVAGSTMENAGFSPETTTEGIESIRARAGQLVPSLRDAPILRTWAGLRPVTPDGRPYVGPDPEISGLWYATGHGRNGVLFAGVTAQILEDLISGRPTLKGAELLRPERFWSW